jgi:hypothetical protein
MDERRYVILRHEGIRDPHFDLMVELAPGALLLTWRSPDWPIVRETNLVKLTEHRRLYLEYEGEISGGRGTVRRVAEGTCALEWRTRAKGVITLLAPPPPVKIHLRHLDDDHWLATPASA